MWLKRLLENRQKWSSSVIEWTWLVDRLREFNSRLLKRNILIINKSNSVKSTNAVWPESQVLSFKFYAFHIDVSSIRYTCSTDLIRIFFNYCKNRFLLFTLSPQFHMKRAHALEISNKEGIASTKTWPKFVK